MLSSMWWKGLTPTHLYKRKIWVKETYKSHITNTSYSFTFEEGPPIVHSTKHKNIAYLEKVVEPYICL